MHARVTDRVYLTPSLVRLTLAGGNLSSLVMPDATDAYVNVALRPEDAPYPEIFDPAQVREQHPRESQPARRRYSVRAWDPVAAQMTIDVVVHGDDGPGGRWAADAPLGSVLVFTGPSGGYRPDPDAPWHLMVGDESALPAIAASLEAVPAGVPVIVRLVCDSPAHEVALETPGRLDLRWLHREGSADPSRLLLDAVQELELPAGRGQAFVHGEATEIREIRRHLLGERGLERRDMSCSPYWRRNLTDEAWREVKRDFVAAMEQDVA